MAIRDDIKDQYMMGDNILVAPVFEGEHSRKVFLPAGKWYDFYTGKLVGENQQVTIETPLERIPLFVRDGGIIPMVPVSLHAAAPGPINFLLQAIHSQDQYQLSSYASAAAHD